MRHATALAAALSFAATFAAAGPTREVNLDRPGALDALSDSNPAHYARILVILRVSQMESCEHLPQVLKTSEGLAIGDVRCDSFTLLTSYPPKRHMTFVLDDVRYTSNVAQVQLQKPKSLPVETWFTQPSGFAGSLP